MNLPAPPLLKQRVYETLEGENRFGRFFNIVIIALISGSVIATIFEFALVEILGDRQVLKNFETFCVVVFTIEYAARLWSTDWPRQSNPRVMHSRWDAMKLRSRTALRPLMIVDLMSILPYYMHLLLPFLDIHLSWIRIIRVFRIFRLFKLARYSAAMATFGYVFRDRKRELLVLLAVIVMVQLIAANLMWELEGRVEGQAENTVNENLQDVEDSFWWSIVTITSTGYGDIYPRTSGGKLLAAVLMIVGIGFVAIPAGLVGASLLEMVGRMKEQRWKTGNYNGHIVICGWNTAGETIIREFEASERRKIVIISRSGEISERVRETYKVIEEDFTKDSVLRGVICREPGWEHPCLIVLAEKSQGQSIEDVDARTLMTTMLAERIAREQKGISVGAGRGEDALYTITQMLEPENAKVLRESVATANEVFVSGDVIGGMIASSAVAAGSSEILQELFSSSGENRLFSVETRRLPMWKEEGVTFAEIDQCFNDRHAIAIGYATEGGLGEIVLNPDFETRLAAGAEIVYYISRKILF